MVLKWTPGILKIKYPIQSYTILTMTIRQENLNNQNGVVESDHDQLKD